MHVSHKVDHGLRALTALAQAAESAPGRPVPLASLAEREDLPAGSLDDILRTLRNRGLVTSVRGGEGGWSLVRPASSVAVADVIRALEGPMVAVRGFAPHDLVAAGEREPFVSLWIATRAALRSVLEHVTLADLAAGRLPADVAVLLDDPEAWANHGPFR